MSEAKKLAEDLLTESKCTIELKKDSIVHIASGLGLSNNICERIIHLNNRGDLTSEEAKFLLKAVNIAKAIWIREIKETYEGDLFVFHLEEKLDSIRNIDKNLM